MPGLTAFMNDDKMEKYIDALLNTILKVNPKLQSAIEKAPELRMHIKQVLKAQLDPQDKGLPEHSLMNDKNTPLILKYALSALTALGLVKEKNILDDIKKILEPLMKDQEKVDSFMKEFKKLVDKQLPPKELVKKVEELIKNKFGDKALENTKDGMRNLLKKTNDYLKDKGIEPKEQDDPMINLTGLLSNQPGSYFIPQETFIGNGLGFVDMNPNAGIANIDLENSVVEGPFGDPLGLVASNQMHIAQNLSSTMDDNQSKNPSQMFSEELREMGFSTTPRLRV